MRRLFHERWRTRVSLLAAGCLDGAEREATLHHLDACAECRREHKEAAGVLELLAADPACAAETPIALTFLVKRVEARLDALQRSRPYRWGWLLASVGVAAAVLVAVVYVVPPVTTSFVARLSPATSPAVPLPETVAMDEDELRRVERRVAREQAVRYLDEAQDVLVTMAAVQRPCSEQHDHVQVGDEARRSRELLARRALLVELEDDGLASARPVLEDVEHVLREVAALESCARGGDVERVQRELVRGRLLMKIRLMSRELAS